jgi:hypothetical protein
MTILKAFFRGTIGKNLDSKMHIHQNQKKNGRGLNYLSNLRTGVLYRERYKSTSCQSFSWAQIPFGPPFLTLLTVMTADAGRTKTTHLLELRRPKSPVIGRLFGQTVTFLTEKR